MNRSITCRYSHPLLSLLTLLLIALIPTLGLAQDNYEHGNGALQIFDAQGMANSPKWVMVWVYFMLISFAASLFFVKNHVEARWVAGGFVVGAILITLATRLIGLPPLSGLIALMHLIAWTPALIVLLKRRPFTGPLTAFSIWAGVMTFVILFSFIFDIRDAAIFVGSYL